MAFSNDDRDGLQEYLLGQISEDQRQTMEQRLLTDDEFFEELEIAEDELIDAYLDGALAPTERQLFEQLFLASPERLRKLRFARALTRPNTFVAPVAVTLTERIRLVWNSQTWLLRAAAVAAVVIVIAGVMWFARPHVNSPQTYATITLTISNNDRAQGGVASRITLPLQTDALRLRLVLPETATRYRVELLRENGETENLKTVGQDEQAVVVEVAAAQLSRGQYALRVHAIKPDGTEQRIKGSYLLTLE